MNLNHLPRNSRTRTYSRVSVIRGRRLVVIWLAAAIIYLPLSQSLKAVEAAGMKLCGEITTRGVSKVDGMLAISGETIFSGSSIATEQNTTAIVSLGRLGRIELIPDSSMRLNFSETGVVGSLAAGGLRVSLPAGVPGTVTTGDTSVIVGGDEAVLFFVTIKDDATIVTVQAGRLQLRAFGKTQQIIAGQSASASRGSLSLDTSQQTTGAQNLSASKKAGIFLGIGGAIAILLIVFTGGNNNNQAQSGGCVTILSPTANSPQCF